MVTLFEGAYAKLNLTLDVLDKREDGFHNIKSIMQTVSIRDDIQIDLGTGKPWQLNCDKEGVPTDASNLAWKAAELFFKTVAKDPDGLTITITKRIPMEAGLAGGSADAAAVLRALNTHYGAPFSIMALSELGGAIGSDVPFCVLCGAAMAEGRGEKLRVLPSMPDCFIVVCKPDFSSSTPELYKKIDESVIGKRPDHQAVENGLYLGEISQIAANLCNVFDPLVTKEHLELNYIKSIFNSYGSIGQQMTGSGSAVFAIVESFEYAAVICNMLRENYPQVFICKPV